MSVRRLLTDQGIVIGGDSRKRTSTGLLATLVRARAGHRCTEPYCDAPRPHRTRRRRWTHHVGERARVCQFHNHVREQPGWRRPRPGRDRGHHDTHRAHLLRTGPAGADLTRPTIGEVGER